jgi:hypothetical protein
VVAAGLAVTAALAGSGRAEELPPDRRVELRLGPEGFIPMSIATYRPLSREIVPLDIDQDGEADAGCLRATDGHHVAALIFASGSPTLWGPVIFYVAVEPGGAVVEWAGDPPWVSRARVRRDGPVVRPCGRAASPRSEISDARRAPPAGDRTRGPAVSGSRGCGPHS